MKIGRNQAKDTPSEVITRQSHSDNGGDKRASGNSLFDNTLNQTEAERTKQEIIARIRSAGGETSTPTQTNATQTKTAEEAEDPRATLTTLQRLVRQRLRRFNDGQTDTNVTEREAFAATVSALVQQEGGLDASEAFFRRFDNLENDPRAQTEKGLVWRVNRGLKAARVSGALSRSEAHEIRSRAFGAAQFDSDPLSMRPSINSIFEFQQSEVLAGIENQMNRYINGEDTALNRPQRKELKRFDRLEKKNSE